MMQQSTVPRNATLASGSGIRRNARSWEQEIIDYDRDGPGVLGYYLDSVALMASLCPLYPSVRDEKGVWSRSDNPVLKYALARFKGGIPEQSQTELVYTAVRSRESLGRCWYVNDPELGWTIITHANAKDGWLTWKTMYGTERRTSSDRVYQSWIPDDYEPHTPKSPVRRALDELRILRAINRNVTHSLNSRLVTNGILAFERDQETARPMSEPGVPPPDDPIVESYLQMAKLAHQDGDSPAASVPFAFTGKPPTWVEIGANVDQGTIQIQEKAIEGFARSVNFPQQLLTEGPGAANHWNEYLLQESQVKMGLSPKLIPVCTDIYNCYYRPVLQKLRDSHSAFDINPDDVRIDYDLDFLLRRPSRLSELMEAYRLGAVTREAIIEELAEEPFEIPEGLSEYEHWELATGNKGAPYAEVDAANNSLIIPEVPPETNPDGSPIDPFGSNPDGSVAGQDEAAPEQPALPGMEQAGGAPAAPQALPPLSPNMGGAPPDNPVEEPEMPSVAAAAVSGTPPGAPPDNPDEEMPSVAAAAVIDATARARQEFDPNDVYADAAKRDHDDYNELLVIVEAAAAAALLAVAKDVIKAHPRGSELRDHLTKLDDPANVLREADPQYAGTVDTTAVIDEALTPYRKQVQAILESSEESFIQKWGPLLAVVAAAGLAAIASKFFTDRVKHTLEPRFLIWIHNKKPGKIPATAMIVRQTLAVAGGAAITADGQLALDVNKNVIPAEGGEWKGNLGHFTGHNWVKAYAGPVTPESWVWVHGWLGEPETPFPPHQALHMQSFNNPSEVPFGLHIDDHHGCRCGWIIVWPKSE